MVVQINYQVKSRTVLSAADENTHGCLGCQQQSNTPKLRSTLCPFNTFTGTISGFCSKSLNKFNIKSKFLNVKFYACGRMAKLFPYTHDTC